MKLSLVLISLTLFITPTFVNSQDANQSNPPAANGNAVANGANNPQIGQTFTGAFIDGSFEDSSSTAFIDKSSSGNNSIEGIKIQSSSNENPNNGSTGQSEDSKSSTGVQNKSPATGVQSQSSDIPSTSSGVESSQSNDESSSEITTTTGESSSVMNTESSTGAGNEPSNTNTGSSVTTTEESSSGSGFESSIATVTGNGIGTTGVNNEQSSSQEQSSQSSSESTQESTGVNNEQSSSQEQSSQSSSESTQESTGSNLTPGNGGGNVEDNNNSASSTESSSGTNNQEGNASSPTGPQTSPAKGVCPAIQFTQIPTNTDVTFTGQTTRTVEWVDVHINVLNPGDSVYPSDAPVENNGWFWNYRMDKVSERTFNFQYTTGPNGFNFDPSKQRLQYFFTYCSQMVDCNTQSFVYNPSGVLSTNNNNNNGQPGQVLQTKETGSCPVLNFTYNVVPQGDTYRVEFTPLTSDSTQWVDVHINVIEPGERPYPSNAIVEANNWFWNFRMNAGGNNNNNNATDNSNNNNNNTDNNNDNSSNSSNNNNVWWFDLPTGANGMNYDNSDTLQFFFTYLGSSNESSCNTQSFVFNPASGARVSPAAPSLTPIPDIGASSQWQTNAQGQTLCEQYAYKMFGAYNSSCLETAFFAAVVNRALYGYNATGPPVNGIILPGSPVWDLLKKTIPYNGQQIDLKSWLNNGSLASFATQQIIHLMGRLFGCRAHGFPDWQYLPAFQQYYQYADINRIRNAITGLNVPQTTVDYVNTSIINALKSLGVSESDIDSVVRPALTGFEAGLAGQQTNSQQQARYTQYLSSAKSMIGNAIVLAIAPLVVAFML